MIHISYPKENISNKNIFLRPLETTDAGRILKWLNDKETTRHLDFSPPTSKEDEVKWIQRMHESEIDFVFAIETTSGTHVGNIGLHDVDMEKRTATLGLFIGDPKHKRKGYAREAINALLNFARTSNLRQINAPIHKENAASIKLFSSLGFERVGEMTPPEDEVSQVWKKNL